MSRKPGPATSRWRRGHAVGAGRVEKRPRQRPAARGDRKATARSCSAGVMTTGRAPAARTSARTARTAAGRVRRRPGVRIHAGRGTGRARGREPRAPRGRPSDGRPRSARSRRRPRIGADAALDAAHVGDDRLRARRRAPPRGSRREVRARRARPAPRTSASATASTGADGAATAIARARRTPRAARPGGRARSTRYPAARQRARQRAADQPRPSDRRRSGRFTPATTGCARGPRARAAAGASSAPATSIA